VKEDTYVQILVIEDEPKVRYAAQEGLRAGEYDVTLAFTGEEVFFLANSRAYDLVVLDVMLPGRDGSEDAP